MTGALMCLACGLDTTPCGCATAGADLDAGFVRRRSLLPASRPAWGSAEEAAHMSGDCDPDRCARCVTVKTMRGDQ